MFQKLDCQTRKRPYSGRAGSAQDIRAGHASVGNPPLFPSLPFFIRESGLGRATSRRTYPEGASRRGRSGTPGFRSGPRERFSAPLHLFLIRAILAARGKTVKKNRCWITLSAQSEVCERVFPGTPNQADLSRSRRLHSQRLGDPPGSGNRDSQPGISKLGHENRS